MYINPIQTQIDSQASFRAKFIHTEDLKSVAEWAVRHNKFDRLNQARKDIDKAYLTRYLKFELFTAADGKPFVIFTRFTPKKDAPAVRTAADYIESEPMIYECSKAMNPLKYGYLKLIKLANGAPNNRMYDKIVKGISKN